MPTERITFEGHAGHKLSARLDTPDGPHLATALFAHCFTCSKDIPAARRIAARLNVMGIAVLRFDFTGLGHFEGEFKNTSFSSNVDDLVHASNFLAGRKIAPDMLIGHSLGGAAVLRAANQIETVKAVVTIGAPFDPEHVTENFASAISKINAEGQADICLGGRPFNIKKHFINDIAVSKLGPSVAKLNCALLVLHAPMDNIVSIDNAAAIFTAAKHPKSFVTLDDADHLISRAKDAEYTAGVIAAWAERYLELAPPAPPIGVPEGIVRITEADPNGFLQDIASGPSHHALADEPIIYGGTNRGMSPYGFMSAGLGACTSMTIRMYARRKDWPLKAVRVDVSHNKSHAQDADPDAGTQKIDVFKRSIFLEGDLNTDQRARLLEIADKCPVHKTLMHSSKIKTFLAG